VAGARGLRPARALSGMRAWRPRAGWIVAGLLGLLAAAALLGDNGLIRLWELRWRVTTLHREVQQLEAENERLSRSIDRLREDPSVVEQIARERLGLVRPGERVLRFPAAPAPREEEGAPGPAVPRARP